MNRTLLAVDRKGVLIWKNNTGVLYNDRGRPVTYGLVGSADILCCVGGRFVALEAKTGNATQSGQQKKFQAAVETAGGLYAVVRKVEDAVKVVDDLMANR